MPVRNILYGCMALLAWTANEAVAMEKTAIAQDFAMLAAQWQASADRSDTKLHAAGETRALAHSTAAHRQDGLLIVTTAAGERNFRNDPATASGQALEWPAESVAYYYVGEIPSLHLAIVEKLQNSWQEFMLVDRVKGTQVSAIPSLTPALRNDGKRLVFAADNINEDSKQGLQIFEIGPQGLMKETFSSERLEHCFSTIGETRLARIAWHGPHTLRATYTYNVHPETAPPYSATQYCDVKVN